MILLDTHVWRWLVNNDPNLTRPQREAIAGAGDDSLGVSVISCWEVAKAVETGRLQLAVAVEEWIDDALEFPNVVLLPLTPQIAVESTKLPQPIHRDPGDQLIIATARVLDITLVTSDAKILGYPHVRTLQ